MNELILSNNRLRISRQNIQSRYIKIELLNYRYQTIDYLEGKCIGGNITIDAESDIRRTSNLELIINDSSFELKPGGKNFLDKYLRLWAGTYELVSGEISWENCGIYIIDAPSYQYDQAKNSVSMSLLDLMAKMTGARNGYLEGKPISFKAGEKLRGAIIAMLDLAGFTNYIVDSPPSPGLIPYDIELGQGVTLYEALKSLLDIYPDYEMFFDINGTFIYRKRPTGIDDPVVVDDKLWDSIVISENINVDFQNVKNSIEVYGRTHDPKFYSENTTISGSNINLQIADVSEYISDAIYGFVLKDSIGYTDMTLNINNLAQLPITLSDGLTSAKIPEEGGDVYFCVQYKGNHWEWLGHLQAYAYAEDINPKSPFYVNGSVGRIRLPLYGGEYENIYSDELAQQRADRELYIHTNLNNTITLECVPVYWLSVNLLVRYTTRRNKETGLYIIKSISLGATPSDTMTVNLAKFIPN